MPASHLPHASLPAHAPSRWRHVLAVAGLMLATTVATAKPTWISLDEPAYQVLRAGGARLGAVEMHPMQVQRPLAGGPALVDQAQRLYLVQLDDSDLLKLSADVHRDLHRCGGFIVHASLNDGRQALARLRALALSPEGVLRAASVPSYALDDGARVQKLLPKLQESAILAGIQRLAAYRNRFYTSTTGAQASDDLFARWQALAAARSDVSVAQYTHSWRQKSVVLTVRGRTAPSEVVVIGGHLDSISGFGIGNMKAPGADDNASGIATLEEVARVLIESGYKPQRTLQFMAYAAEEVGLRGSSDIATQYFNDGRNVVGALQLDMTNYNRSAYDITLITDYTNAAQNDFLANLAAAYLPDLVIGRATCGYACSDHASWTRNGFAASFPFEAPLGLDNPHIHTPQDTLDQSGNSAANAFKFARLTLAYAVELGSDAGAP